MKTRVICLLILMVGVIYGCSDMFNGDDDSSVSMQDAKVVISLTDAPIPDGLVAEANVTIDYIQLKTYEGDEDCEQDSTCAEDGSESPFTTLEVDATFNLLELSNGITEVLGELDSVPAGEYSEIRMHIVDAGVVLNDGSEYDLKVPSGSSSGLKIKISPSLVVSDGGSYEVLLDIDASRSFKMQGNANGNDNGKGNSKETNIKGFIFTPVVRAVNVANTGTVYGVVTNADTTLQNANLYLVTGVEPELDTVASAKTCEEGMFRIIGVPEGSYTLSCEKEGFQPASADVAVSVGAETEQNFALTEASEE